MLSFSRIKIAIVITKEATHLMATSKGGLELEVPLPIIIMELLLMEVL